MTDDNKPTTFETLSDTPSSAVHDPTKKALSIQAAVERVEAKGEVPKVVGTYRHELSYQQIHKHVTRKRDEPEEDAVRLDGQFRQLISIVYAIDPRAQHGIILCALDRSQMIPRFHLHVRTSGGEVYWFHRGVDPEEVRQVMLKAAKEPGPERTVARPVERKQHKMDSREEYQAAVAATAKQPYYCSKCGEAIKLEPGVRVGSANIWCLKCS